MTEALHQMTVRLADLPRGHELRTRPLGEVGAECRNKLSKDWREMKRWAIARCSYDELGEAWTETSEFRVTQNASSPSGVSPSRDDRKTGPG